MSTPSVPRPRAAGDGGLGPQRLTLHWRVTLAVGWGLIFFGMLGVLITSQRLGLNTWWLGPFGDPASPFVTVVPFIAPALVVVLALNNVRFTPWAALAAATTTALVGVADLDRVARLAFVEIALGGAGALLAVASFAGYTRPLRDEPAVSVP